MQAATGIYLDTKKVRAVAFRGKHHQVQGALNVPRGPQGRPVYVQAGSSVPGRAFGARWAEAIFTAHLDKQSATDFYTDIKRQAVGFGRERNDLVILPGISATLGSNEEEARRADEELNELNRPEVGLSHLSNRFGGHDFTHLQFDRPLTVGDFPDLSTVQASLSRAEGIVKLATTNGLTLRQLLHQLAGARGHFTVVGTPEKVADTIEDWFTSGAADGFNVMPPILPAQFEIFSEEVVPILQKRGLFRQDYRGETLREHLELARPESSYFPRRQVAAE